MPDKVKILYDALSGEYDLGAFEDFKSKMSDQTKRRTLYDAVGKSYDLGTFEEFESKIAPSGPVPAARPMPTGGLPSFQEQVEYMTPLVQQENRFEKAAVEDKKKSGNYIGAIFDSFVSAIDPLKYLGEEKFFDAYGYMTGKKLTPIERDIRRSQFRGAFNPAFGAAGFADKTQSKEYMEDIQGGWDVTDGFGVKDLKALGVMGARVAGDVGVAVAAQAVGVPMGTTYFLQGYGTGLEDYSQMIRDKGLTEDETTKQIYALSVGTINGLLEKFAFDKIFGKGPAFNKIKKEIITDLLLQTSKGSGKLTVNVLEKTATDIIQKKLSSFGKRATKVAFASGVEGFTEGSQNALEDAVKLLSNKIQGQEVFDEEDIKKNFLKNVLNSAVAGAALGAPMGLTSTFLENVDNKLVEEIANASNEEELNVILSDLEDVMVRSNASEEEIGLMRRNAERYNKIKQTIPVTATADEKSKIISLIDRRDGIDEKINQWNAELEQIDDAMKPDVESEVSILTDSKDMINDEIREISTGQQYEYYEENGKYYKKIGEKDPIEITKSRFELQKIKEDATKESTEQIEERRAEGDIGQRQGAEEVQDQETAKTDIGYRYIVSEEGDDIPIAALLNKKIRINGRPAILYQQGETVEARIIGTNRIIEIGNVVKLLDELPEAYGIELDETLVTENPFGYRVEGQDMVNSNENPLDAISFDQNGNVMNVVLTTPAGKRRKFRGQVAKDLAYQIQLKEILKDEEQFEEFLAREHQAELDAAAQLAAQQESEQVQEPTEEQAVGVDETVSPRQVEPTYGRVTDRGADVRVPNPTKEQRKVISDARNVASSLRSLIPAISGKQVTINLHDSNSFAEAVIAAGGDEQSATSRGFYMGTDGSIHINMDNVNTDTVLHEGFHPVLDFIQAANPELINDLFSQLESIPEAADIIENARSLYQGDITQKKEAITDFVAGVADGRVQLNPSNFQKIKSFILDMLSRIGIGKGSPKMMKVNNQQDLIKLATFVTEKFKVGEEITFDGILEIVGDETVDPINISNIAVVDAAQFELARTADKAFRKVDIKWSPKGIGFRAPQSRSTLYEIVSTSGGAVVVINSDATGIGVKNGVLRQGGIGYTFIEQNIEDNIGFAASMDSKQTAFYKAVQEAAKIRDERFPDMKGKPVAIFVMVQAPEVMFGNAYGADYFIKSLSYALSNNQITAEDAKADIAAYFNSIKETNNTGRKYSNSIDKLLNLIESGNLRSPKTKKEIYDLLISNRENKEDKSPKFGFDARRVLFGQFYNKVGNAKNKPGGRLRDLLDKDGFNHKDFYKKFGDENVIKSLEGRTEGDKLSDGGFSMTGFFVDPTISEQEFVERSKSGKFQHKQFNGKFFGTNPFVLDGKYYVNEVFPEARFLDKYGEFVPVTTSAGGSMYPRTKEAPEAIIKRARAISAEPQMQRQYADVVNGFYSPIVKRVNEFKQPNASATKWKEIVGFKTDEAVYSGLTDWLNSKKPNEQVSKEDVLKFMKDNRIQIIEKTRGGDYKVYDQRTDKEIETFETLEEAQDFVASAREDGDMYEIEETVDFLMTRYENYQLPGGKNYKERLVILPGMDMFESSHFSESNILVHLRMNIRTDADGKKVLFLEEVQSDWGQKGKREGFKGMTKASDFEILSSEPSYYDSEKGSWRYEVKFKVKGFEGIDRVGYFPNMESLDEFKERMAKSYNKFVNITPAPFVTDTNAWVKLGLKVALKEAVKEGVDRIAWTTGQQQNDRYDLRKQVDEIQYNDNGDGTYSYSAVKNNYEIGYKKNVSIKVIEEDLGKDIADKILASEGSKIPFSQVGEAKSLKGEDLKFGGKGMIAFYGDAQNVGIVGKVAKAVVKELTGKEGAIVESKIPSGIQPAIDITPELKQSVKAGMPQFQKAPIKPMEKQQRTNLASDKLKRLFNRDNIPLNISEAKEIVNEVIDWASWYDGISDYVNNIFEEYSEDILSLLPLSSQAANSATTVALAINNAEKIYKGEQPVGVAEYYGYVTDFLQGKGIKSDKMYNFFKAITGDKDAVAVDMHVWSIIMGKDPNKKQVNPKNKAEFDRAKEFVNLLSTELGLSPREVQAALWAANILRTGKNPTSYEQYFEKQVKQGLNERIEEWRKQGYKPFSEIRKARESVRAKGEVPQFQKAPTEALAKKGLVGITKLASKEYAGYGVLGKEGIILKEKKAGELSAELATAEKYAKDAILLTKKYKNSVSKKYIEDFMTGKDVEGNLPADLAAALSNAREHVDNLTERLIQLGVIDDQESIDHYRANKGKYLLRSYEAIDYNEKFGISQALYGKGLNIDNVAKKLKNVDQTVVDAALKFLANRAMAENPSLSEEKAMAQARKEANRILSNSEEYFTQKGLTGSTNIQSLSKRLSDEELSPELRALMGEYTDPIYKYYASVFKIASLTSSRQYLNSMKEYGMGKFIFEDKNATEDATVKIAGEGSKGLEPLNGLYTFPEIYEALKKAENDKPMLITQLAGRVRKFKTVYNPATHIKNVIGNTGFTISNGHWNYIPEAYKYMRASIVGGDDKDVMRMMDTLNRYGVLNNTLGIGELKQYFKRNENVDDFLTEVYKAGGKNKAMVGKVAGAAKDFVTRQIPKFIEKAYQIEDDLFKILGFVNESNRYAKAKYQKAYDKLNETEKKDIDSIASEIVKDTYPTFTRVPKGVKVLSKALFLGNFLSFPVESVRVQYNALALAIKEILSENPRLKAVGLSRIAGAIAYNSLFSSMVYYGFSLAGAGLTGMLGLMNGDDEEETENSKAIQRYVAPWNKNTDKYPTSFANGKLSYYDIGSLDSYNYQKRVWNAFWSNLNNKEGFNKAISQSMSEALDPWLQRDFVLDNFNKLMTNPNNSIYNPKDEPWKQWLDKSMFVAKQMGPGFVGASIKIADSYTKGDYEKAINEAYSQIVRRYDVDLEKQFRTFIYVDNTNKNSELGFKDALRNTEKIYKRAKESGAKGIELNDAYREAVDKYKEQVKIIREYYNSAIRGGVPAKNLNEIMNKSGFSAAVKKGVIEGKFNLPDKSYIKK